MWTTGLILYEIATGRIAYSSSVDGCLVQDWYERVLAGRSPEEVVTLPPDTNPAVKAVLQACQRPVSAAQSRPTAASAFAKLFAALPPEEARRRYSRAADHSPELHQVALQVSRPADSNAKLKKVRLALPRPELATY